MDHGSEGGRPAARDPSHGAGPSWCQAGVAQGKCAASVTALWPQRRAAKVCSHGEGGRRGHLPSLGPSQARITETVYGKWKSNTAVVRGQGKSVITIT